MPNDRTNTRLLVVAFLIACLAGCARLDVAASYQAPSAISTPASRSVDRPFDQVWNDLVRRLSQSFFNVDQVAKDSRLINLSIRDTQVDGFITCGRIDYTVNGEPWSFDPAESARLSRASHLKSLDVMHETSGRVGRMNIFVAPDGDGTIIEVNASFELTIREHGEAVQNNLIGRRDTAAAWEDSRATFQLTSTQPQTQTLGGRAITCQSSRVWESRILEMAR